MDWPVILFFAVVAFFAYRGYKKGLLRSLSRVFSLLAGYAAAILFTEQVSAILAPRFELEGMVSYIAAGLGLFFAAGITVSIVFWIIVQLLPAQDTPSTASAFGGLAIGSMVGVIVAIIAVWSFTFVRDFRGSPGVDELGSTIKQSFTLTMICTFLFRESRHLQYCNRKAWGARLWFDVFVLVNDFYMREVCLHHNELNGQRMHEGVRA